MANPQDIQLANPLASDLNVQAELVSMYRVRGDKHYAIVDFGYAPPLMPEEAEELSSHPAQVHTRLAIPYELVDQLIHTLAVTQEAARKFHAGASQEPKPPSSLFRKTSPEK
ncbi:hypothetical protein COW36_15560 [bacterium (Candidatus Blackallbacteria) CG17_big_fil_post_rev_8_21_14_2_50_48_46]|uniref:Uncharacterized protein n=1 Tax=bacterium (Candidatus Blackallbacteria) CG17_big_fil_post_rev_8_21_14_2_50_48_46 TaxID=2014261 RepID=A0A2M7G265_9BACT|nr:MAG: hypothetical protein COW64_07675 [bacterium (Candidatus Blackallbacteria) CG18_big_fil_WC_8_21_14_2_50_49_26]PIW15885.1 MAG: hypothetical protein COW36_15560 [bacterium (Candidatus Blackallbacteria) CG17_big_fil_post_rev_8_21_14_2_50_48_46]PIW48650.1 MAG: hypothetical protein COW20_08610 [bacterium (Candidatus Blackallbacteria) CG13_big_fil_rev_8_21_14_2_50_49_14]